MVHILSENGGLPLVVGVTAANTHDSVMFVPLLDGIPAIRSRRGPRRRRPGKLHADKAYDAEDLRAFCRRLGIAPRIARKGIESSQRLGRHRWRIERTISWIFGYRRLTIRYERKATYLAAFLSLAASLTCYKKLAKLAT
jgi:transposase